MNKTEFRIDEVKFGNGEKQYFVFYKAFNIFGFPKWKLYAPANNPSWRHSPNVDDAFSSVEQAEKWLRKHLEQKELSKMEPYVTDRKFITI